MECVSEGAQQHSVVTQGLDSMDTVPVARANNSMCGCCAAFDEIRATMQKCYDTQYPKQYLDILGTIPPEANKSAIKMYYYVQQGRTTERRIAVTG
eukprot:1428187-Pleurochrysis_carterae.AAC.1